MLNISELLDKLFITVSLGLLASFGAAANFVYITISQERRFSFTLFLCNLFLAFFVGAVFGEFVDSDNKYRYGGVMLAGFFAYPLLGIVETQGRKWVESWINRNIP